MSVARGTTPTYILTFTEQSLDLTEANHVYVTFRKGAKVLTKTGTDIEVYPKRVEIYLNQKETLAFSQGEVKVQVNWTWQLQTDVTNVFQSGVKYVKG